jgi:peptide chain release factor subunit 1
MQSNEIDPGLIQFKVKRMIRYLDEAKGDGTSMISVIIPPGKKVADIQKQLVDEYGKAEHIKDRVNRQSVLGGITSAKEKLKTFNRVPKMGLLIYCGTVWADDGKTTKKMMIDFEPHKQINTSMYNCGNHFITGPLKELLESDEKFGFIIVDGLGVHWATLQGNTREIISKFSVDLPKKHGRGGQSSNRFANTREEKRAAYVKKVCEGSTACFITDDRPNIAGIVLGGYADFKTRVAESQFFDERLKRIIVNVVDISYGGEQGLNQAIDLSQTCLKDIQLVKEQNVIGKFYEMLNIDHEKIIYGIIDTMRALEDGVVQKLILFDDMEQLRVVLKKQSDDEPVIRFMKPAELVADGALIDEETKEEMDLIEKEPFVDWMAENYKDFGAELVFVTDRSPEGSQFVKGFGGIGGFLRYKVDYDADHGNIAEANEDSEEDFI